MSKRSLVQEGLRLGSPQPWCAKTQGVPDREDKCPLGAVSC